ncbi:MAG: restriction endonuclease subunit S [bacterium]|nr:restriction endonuclease subunit S [bacterium]
MAERINVPEIRFKRFDDNWQENKLDEVADFSKGQGYSKGDLVESGTPIVLYGRLYTDYQVIIDNVNTYVSAKQGSIYSNGREVIVPSSGESAEDIARASTILKKGVLLGGDLNIVYPNKTIDPIFLALNISNGIPHKDLTKRAQGKSVVHLRNNDLKEIELIHPSPKEQSKIGTYFQKLDKLITLHQQKYDKLVTIKKAMLEKMFPQKGADVPEIRFKGFTGTWNLSKLRDIADITGGGTPGTNIKEYWDGDIDWYSPTEIGNAMYANGSIKKITSLGLEKSSAKILPAYKTVLFTSRAGIGDMAILERDGATNQGFQSLVLKNGYEAYFIYSAGSLIKKYALKYASGSTFLEISSKQLGNMDIYVPEIKEQSKIGEYFQNLDNLITLHQKELKKLKNIKKACLEKMFI